MDKRVLRERMRKKQRQLRMRRYMKLATYAVAAVLVVIFMIRGVIFPIIDRVGGKGDSGQATGEILEVQAEAPAGESGEANAADQKTEEGKDTENKEDTDALSDKVTASAGKTSVAALRQPVLSQNDIAKASQFTSGWHEDETGRWYQNTDGTYFSSGLQEIDGTTYAFDENGYMQTGWVTKGINDYYFNEDGSYNPEKIKPRIALTFDDGPGQYTDRLLDVIEETGAHVTFFMLGKNVGSYPEAVKRMVELGCEIGSHSWDHPQLTNLSIEDAVKQFTDTDEALIQACGQPATVGRAPYGAWSSEIINAVEKPFFMWSLDTLDWQTKDEENDYNVVMNGDLTDGAIILMHDIHEPTVNAAERLIPDLINAGYRLLTVSELAEAKGVDLQYASYSDFWDSSLENGLVAGYTPTGDEGGSEGENAEDGSGEGDFDDGSDGDGDDFTSGEEEY